MKELIKNTIIYSIARIIPGITGFILLPIYTKYLVPSEYGKVQSMQILGFFLIIIFSLASERSIFRLYYDYKTEKLRNEFIGNVFLLILFSVILLSAIIFFLKNYVNQIFSSIEFYPFYFYIIFHAAFTSFSFIPLNLFQVQGKAVKFTLYSVLSFSLSTSLILYFLLIENNGAEGILQGQLLASFIMLIFYLVEILKKSILRFNKEILKNILMFSTPFIPVLLSSWFMNMSSRVFLDLFIEDSEEALSEIGIYSFAFKISSVSAIVIASIYTAYNPIFYKEVNKINQFEVKSKLSRIKYYYCLIALSFCFLISFLSKEIVSMYFSKEYLDAIFLIPILSICFFLNQVIGLYNLMIYQNKKTNKVMVNYIISSVLTIILSLFLIPIFSSYGAAISALLGYIFNVFLQKKTALKYYYIDFKLNKILFMLLILYIIVYFDIYFLNYRSDISLLVKIFFITILLFSILYLNKKELISFIKENK